MIAAPSILYVVKKLRRLLTREEKAKWFWIICFALCISLLEVLTASAILMFGQVLSQPEAGQKYLSMVGIRQSLLPGQIVFCFAVIVGVVYLIKNLAVLGEVYYQNFSIQRMNFRFKTKMMNLIQNQPYQIQAKRGFVTGFELIASDVEQMFTVGISSLAYSLSELIALVFLISFVFFINFKLATTVSFFFLLVYFFMKRYLMSNYYIWGKEIQRLGLGANKKLLELLQGFKEVIILNKTKFFVEEFSHYAQDKMRLKALQLTVASFPRLILELLFVLILLATVWSYTNTTYEVEGLLSLMGLCVYVGFRAIPGLNRVINHISNFNTTIPCVTKIYDEVFREENKDILLDCKEFKFSDSIQLKNVNFTYKDSKKASLSKVNLMIKKGESVGVIGETGAGKSTLVDIIIGLLKPSEGSILIDGQFPVNSYQWHEKIGYVPQSTYLIDDTIEVNIAFGEEHINKERLDAAIEAAQLRRFITELPEGLNTIAGERGVRLSGGERQRIAIARALYRNPDVLIFDEATSALDNETEAQLMETIRSVSKNRTVIMIAHRLTTLKDCNHIVVVENGTVNSTRSKLSAYEQGVNSDA
jgi:ABC-type multidrug transport system fused ATPase/permease subunit